MKGWRRNYLPTLNVRAVKQRRLYGEAIDAVRASVGAPREPWDRFKEASASRESHRSAMTGVPGTMCTGDPRKQRPGWGSGEGELELKAPLWGAEQYANGLPLLTVTRKPFTG